MGTTKPRKRTVVPTATSGTLAAPAASGSDLSPDLASLEVEIEMAGWAIHHRAQIPYRWEVKEPKLLAGLRVAALVSLREEHGWDAQVAAEFLDRWLASSASDVHTLLACLNQRACQELTRRIKAATGR